MNKIKYLKRMLSTSLSLVRFLTQTIVLFLKYLIESKGKRLGGDFKQFLKNSTTPEKFNTAALAVLFICFVCIRSFYGLAIVAGSAFVIYKTVKLLPDTDSEYQKKYREIFQDQIFIPTIASVFVLMIALVPSSDSSSISGTYKVSQRSQWMSPPILIISGSSYTMKGSLGEPDSYPTIGYGTITKEPPDKDGNIEIKVEGFDGLGNPIQSSGHVYISKKYKTITINVRSWTVDFEKSL